jgi:hypothetical protein
MTIPRYHLFIETISQSWRNTEWNNGVGTKINREKLLEAVCPLLKPVVLTTWEAEI